MTAGDTNEAKIALESGSLDNKHGGERESGRRNFQQLKNRKRNPRCADAECRSLAVIALEREGAGAEFRLECSERSPARRIALI